MVLPFRIQIKPLTMKFVVLKPINKVFQIILTFFSTIVKAIKGQADVKVKTCIFKVSFKIV